MIATLAEAFRYKASKTTFHAFESFTADLSIEAIQRGCEAAVMNLKFFPSVVEFRQFCGCSAGMTPEDRANRAWQIVRSAISREGAYRTVQFSDPIITATIRGLGGWVTICDTESGKDLDTWLRQTFCQFYQSNLATGVEAQEAAPLPGLIAASQHANGYDPPEPVLIPVGLPEISPKLIRGVIREPARLVALPEVRAFVESLSGDPDFGGLQLVGQSADIPIDPEDRLAAVEAERLEKRRIERELSTVASARSRDGQITELRDSTDKPFRTGGTRGEEKGDDEGSSEESGH